MALSKISLKLGKKVIDLTPKQFEELKRDMRELDRSHHYYWHQSPWYSPWYMSSSTPVFCGSTLTSTVTNASTAGVLSFDGSCGGAVESHTIPGDASPPEFSGGILAVR